MSKSTNELIVLHDRRDRPEANRLVRKLESAGYHVARQDNPAGLRRGKTDAPTVVLWSRHAGEHSLRSVLDSDGAVIAKLDSRTAPIGAQVTDLRGWRGQDRHQGWQTLLEAVGPAAFMAPAKIVAAVPAAAKAVAAPATAKAQKKSAAPASIAAVDAEAYSDRVHPLVIALTTLVLLAAAAGAAVLFFPNLV